MTKKYENNNSELIFPNPLSTEEELYYLNLNEKGDSTARDILIEHNLRLVGHVVKKFYDSGYEIDDLISIGTIGLIKAVDTYKLEKGFRLATYACRCIENEIVYFIRRDKKEIKKFHLENIIFLDDIDNPLLLEDIIDSNSDVSINLEREVERKIFMELFNKLNDRSKQIVFLRYIKGMTQKMVGDQFGISQSYVSRNEKRIMKKLKRKAKRLIEG